VEHSSVSSSVCRYLAKTTYHFKIKCGNFQKQQQKTKVHTIEYLLNEDKVVWRYSIQNSLWQLARKFLNCRVFVDETGLSPETYKRIDNELEYNANELVQGIYNRRSNTFPCKAVTSEVEFYNTLKVVCTNVDKNWSRINESWIKQTTN